MQNKTFKIWIISIFPDYFKPLVDLGIVGQALSGKRGVEFEINLINLREHSPEKYKSVDDYPFGGGPGMVMRADILKNAVMDGVVATGNYGEDFKEKLHVIYTGPRGKVWNNDYCKEFAKSYWSKNSEKDLVFICGRYEGVDERFLELYVDEEISIGDYVLSGGELAVMTIIDSAVRFVPGALGNRESASNESFAENLLEHSQYTRPREFDGEGVPPVLLSGNHKKIDEYNHSDRVRLTKKFRPDIYSKYEEKK